MGRRVVLTLGDRERCFNLDPSQEALIGRSLEATLFLNDPSISRKHCLLRGTTTGVEVEDLASRNSCFVNGRRVVNRTMLTEGSVLQVGKLAFAVRFLEAEKDLPCSSCGNLFPPSTLSGNESGEAVCSDCAAKSWSDRGSRFMAAIESAGFRVIEPIGGDPPTFKVERPGVGRIFAIKAIPIPAKDQTRVSRLRDDARALAALDHETITAVYDVIEAEGLLLLVLAFESGETLEQRVERAGPLAPSAALSVAKCVAQAIRHANGKGVLHREVTPRNVLVSENEGKMRAKLTSFPLARDLEELPRSFSAAGELDRLLFVAPELIQEASVADVRADIFGIGSVLLFGLTKRCPWGAGVTPSEHVRRLIGGQAPHLILEGTSGRTKAALEALLDPDRSRRCATPEDALSLLEAAAASLDKRSGTGQSERVIQGEFAGDELVEFLQLIELNGKSGELDVWIGANENPAGQLVLEQGRVFAAKFGATQGQPAARHVLRVREGRFRFSPKPPRGSVGLDLKLAGLLLDILRESDEEMRPPELGF